MAGETAISRTYNLLETATDPSRLKGLWDVISTNVPTIHHFMDEEAVQEAPGDRFRFSVLKELPQVTGAGATQDIEPGYINPWTVAEYGFKFIWVPVAIPNQHIILNQGPNAHFDIVKGTMESMIIAMIESLGGSTRGIWTAGSNDETEQTKLTGLPSLIKSVSGANTTGTTGTISRTNAFWQNQIGTAISSFATNGKSRYQSTILACKRGSDFPDLGVTNRTQFNNYLNIFSATLQMHQPVSGERFDVGVPNVELFGIKMFFDANAPADECRFINTDYLQLLLLENDYMAFDPVMADTKKADTIVRLRFTGNLFARWLGCHGVVSGGDTA